jgi:hypothetical protein
MVTEFESCPPIVRNTGTSTPVVTVSLNCLKKQPFRSSVNTQNRPAVIT